MDLITLKGTDAAVHLAAEEYFFTQSKGDILLLYRNAPSVIIGKYQNPWKEADLVSMADDSIPLLRRLSGGGCVYHDDGCLCYSVIRSCDRTSPGYRPFLLPIMHVLDALGIHAELLGGCNLMAGNRKISGSAQAVHANRILHHGTLLYDTRLDRMKRCLTPDKSYVICRTVSSVPAPVTNIRELLGPSAPSVETFLKLLEERLLTDGAPVPSVSSSEMISFSRRALKESEEREILRLADSRYRSPEWNLCRTKDFQVDKPGMHLEIRRGRIAACQTDFLGSFTFSV